MLPVEDAARRGLLRAALGMLTILHVAAKPELSVWHRRGIFSADVAIAARCGSRILEAYENGCASSWVPRA